MAIKLLQFSTAERALHRKEADRNYYTRHKGTPEFVARCARLTKDRYERRKAGDFTSKPHASSRRKLPPEELKERRYWAWIKRNYGLTQTTFQDLLVKQNHACLVCDRGFTDRPVVDHCHATGRVRGILHRTCNLMLGLCQERIETLDGLIRYIEDECQNNLHSLYAVLYEPERFSRVLQLTPEAKAERKREQRRKAAYRWFKGTGTPIQRLTDPPDLVTYKRHLKWRFGNSFTYEAYLRLQACQENHCALCSLPLFELRSALDHCHATGKVRGILHMNCNLLVGHCEEDPNIARGLRAYILR